MQGHVKPEHVMNVALLFALFFLIGCQSKTTISGILVPINGQEVPRLQPAGLLVIRKRE